MNKVYIMVGPAGVGKSTYAKDKVESLKAKGGVKTFSSDAYRVEMFGSLSKGNEKENSNLVFDKIKSDLKSMVTSPDNDYTYAILDSTNIARKYRRTMYGEIKRWSKGLVGVEIVYFAKSLQTILNQNSNRVGRDSYVPNNIIIDMYNNQQVPRIGVDCDSIKYVGERLFSQESNFNINDYTGNKDGSFVKYVYDSLSPEFIPEFKNIFSGHDCEPHHLENIEQHIQLCVQRSLDMIPNSLNGLYYYSDLVRISMFHDLGKSVTNKMVEKNGTIKATYRGHANVGANYMMNYFYYKNDGLIYDNEMEIVECISQHMNSHQGDGITEKNINKNKLSKNTINMIRDFGSIDSISRIKGECE